MRAFQVIGARPAAVIPRQNATGQFYVVLTGPFGPERVPSGQNAAKKAVAIALRNRVRRQKLQPEMAEDILPKNILMIGPTGVGKTEIARRLARLAGCPFVKVEASKYTGDLPRNSARRIIRRLNLLTT